MFSKWQWKESKWQLLWLMCTFCSQQKWIYFCSKVLLNYFWSHTWYIMTPFTTCTVTANLYTHKIHRWCLLSLTSPSLLKASVWCPPQATAVMFTPFSDPSTLRGEDAGSRLSVTPCPSCPYPLCPQQYRSPVSVSATTWGPLPNANSFTSAHASNRHTLVTRERNYKPSVSIKRTSLAELVQSARQQRAFRIA